MRLEPLLASPPSLALLLVSLSVALLVGLLAAVAAARHLAAQLDSEDSATAWWHLRSSMAVETVDSGCSSGAGGSGGSATAGRLMGGSRGPLEGKLAACHQCGAPDPKHRCANCSSVAYCSRQCQQKSWAAGHKHECKKLRKQKAAARLSSSALVAAGVAGSGAGSEAVDNGAAAAAGSEGSAEAERREESNSAPPVPKQVLYPFDRYCELAASPPQRKQPRGLQNVGNSCYANSLLQSLLATPSLAAYLVSGEHSRGCVKPSASDWCVLCELEKLAQDAYHAGSGVLNPKPLLRHVKRLGKQFCFGRQEDSHELYLRLMEAVEAVQLLEAGGRARYDLRSRETTFIHHVFAGYTRNQICCLSCGYVSRTYECCTSLTLDVSARISSLEAALQRFTATERLDGDNKYKCDGCKLLVPADKSTRLEAAPHVLQICLKRFGPGRFGKITSKLSFPEELDLGLHMAEGCLDGQPPRYSLYAVVVHIDWGRSTDYGHYIAYVKNGSSWYCCDDSSVSPVAAAKVLSAGAYLLFYQRQQPRSPATPEAAAAAAAAGAAAVKAEAPVEVEASETTAGAADSEEAGAAATPASPTAAAAAAAKPGVMAAAEAAADEAESSLSALGEPQTPWRQQQQLESMLRVETAPGSLPHLGADSSASASKKRAAGRAGLSSSGGSGGSSSSSSSHLSDSPRWEQRALERAAAQAAQQGIAVAAPDQLHASASESDMHAVQQRSSADAASSRRRELQQQEIQSGAAAAAAAARQEVECLQQQRVAEQADSGAHSPCSSSSSSSDGLDLWPSLNPYNLLGSEDGSSGSDDGLQEEAEEQAERAGSSTDGSGSGPRSSGSGARPPPNEQQGPAASAAAAAGVTVNAAAAAPAAALPPARQQERQAPGGSRAQPPSPPQSKPGTSSSAAVAVSPMHGPAAGAATRSPGAAAACTPRHRASVTTVPSPVGSQRVLRLSVELPGVEEAQVDWRMDAGSCGSSACQQLLLRAEGFALKLPLPVPVAADAVAAQWARQKLTVTWPLLAL